MDLAGGGDRRELAADLVDQGADGERAEAERPGALDDPGVVEVAAGEPQQVVAERDHGEEMAALIGGERRRRLAQEQVEAGLQGSEGPAELMAEAGEDGAATLPDRSGSERLPGSLGPGADEVVRTSMA